MTTKPGRCATIGHASVPATHEITWTQQGARSEPVTERVCEPCADGYTRRPALKATARKIASPQRGRSR